MMQSLVTPQKVQELWINIVFVETPWKCYFWTWTLTARSSNVNKMMLSALFTHYISMVIQTKHIPCQTWNKGAPWTHLLNWLTHWQVGASSTKFPTTKSLTITLCTFVTRCEIFNPSLNSCFAHHYTCIYKAYLPSLLLIAQCSVLQVINMKASNKFDSTPWAHFSWNTVYNLAVHVSAKTAESIPTKLQHGTGHVLYTQHFPQWQKLTKWSAVWYQEWLWTVSCIRTIYMTS